MPAHHQAFNNKDMPIYGLNKLDKRMDRLGKALQRTIPRRIGQDAENHFRASFKNGGFTDRTLVKWRPRKQQPRDRRGKAKAHTVLFQHGLLRGSVRLVQADWNNIQVVAGGPHVPYARIHNEGGWIKRQVTRRAHTRRAHAANTRRGRILRGEAHVRRHQARMNVYIPKRQFMGDSFTLRQKMRETILITIAEALIK